MFAGQDEMVRLKKDQRIFIIAKYAELKSVCLVQRAFQEEFSFSPDPKTIRAIFSRFKNGGHIADKKRTGRPKSVTTPQNVQQVRQVFLENPKKSTRRAAAELGISRSSVRRILNETKARTFQGKKQSQGEHTSPRSPFCASPRSREHAIQYLQATFIMSEPQPLNVLVTGAAGQIAYSLLYMLGKGDVFGPHQPLTLRLLDIPPMAGVLSGVTMELQDCSLPLLRDVIATTNEAEAFQDVDAAFLVGSMPRKEGMERKELLAANVKIFKSQGKALDQFSKKTVKVLVVGNPANTNALICSRYAPSIPKENFSAMTRLDQNRAQAQVAAKLNIPNTNVRNVIIWGNHSSTQFPDVQHATANINGNDVPVYIAVNDEDYLRTDFISIVQKRGAAVIAARKLSSAMSAAKAACDHMRDWWHGTAPGTFVSMAVYSDGSYGVPKDVMFSFPLTVSANGSWQIVQGLPVSDFAGDKLNITGHELVKEREEALAVCQD